MIVIPFDMLIGSFPRVAKSSKAGMKEPEAGSTLRQANLAPDDIRGATG